MKAKWKHLLRIFLGISTALVALFHIAVLLMGAFGSPHREVLLVVPDAIRGEFRIDFLVPSGEDVAVKNNQVVLRLPASGTLRVRRAMFDIVPSVYFFRARTSSGKALLDQMHASFPEDGTAPAPGPVRAFIRTFVGDRTIVGFVGSDLDEWKRWKRANSPGSTKF